LTLAQKSPVPMNSGSTSSSRSKRSLPVKMSRYTVRQAANLP
jgi:hypothetical protein